MFKKIIAILMVFALVSVGFSGCKKEDTGEALACAISEMPQHFDPQIVSATVEKMIAVNIFDGLFKLNEEGKPEKCMVKDYSVSDDGLVYTFILAENTYYYQSSAVKKHLEEKNATISAKVTAEDFAFGITRGILPETEAADFELLSNIKNATAVHNGTMSSDALGIRVIDEYTLEITLDKATDKLLYALSQPISYPCDKEFFELTGGRYGLATKYIITNGGFYLSNVSEDKSVRIAKNENYIGAFKAIPSAVGFYLNADEISVADKLDKGDYNVGFFTEEDAFDQFGRKVQQNVLKNITCSLIFNFKQEVLQNLSLRTGLVAGADLSRIESTSSQRLLPSYFITEGEAEGIEYNGELAHNSLIKAFEELKLENLSLEILCIEDYEKIAKNIVNSWQNTIGVELNGVVTVVEEKDFNKRINSGDFQLAIYPLTVDSAKGTDFLSLFEKDNAGNVFGYSSEEYNRILANAKETENTGDIRYCESYLLKNAVVLPVCTENTVFALSKDVTEVYFCGDRANTYFYKGQKQ